MNGDASHTQTDWQSSLLAACDLSAKGKSRLHVTIGSYRLLTAHAGYELSTETERSIGGIKTSLIV